MVSNIYVLITQLQPEPLYDEATDGYTETKLEMQPNILYGKGELLSI